MISKNYFYKNYYSYSEANRINKKFAVEEHIINMKRNDFDQDS